LGGSLNSLAPSGSSNWRYLLTAPFWEVSEAWLDNPASSRESSFTLFSFLLFLSGVGPSLSSGKALSRLSVVRRVFTKSILD
jgi:hypothetical protein